MSYTFVAVLIVAMVLIELLFVRGGKITGKDVRELLQFVVITLVLFFGIKYFIAQPFLVDGRSMSPNFETGNYLIVDRLSYRLGDPKRLDVVVFQFPQDPTRYFIKRVIGLPGERIVVRDGVTKIYNSANPNGFVLPEPFVKLASTKDATDVTLASDEYFVMGDNRLESYDSRSWGPLPKHFLSGRAFLRLFPFTQIQYLPADISHFVSTSKSIAAQ